MNVSDLLNENGFLRDTSAWSEPVAREIARREGLHELDPTHWEIIRFLRSYFQEKDFLPTLHRACKVHGDWRESCLSCHFRNNPMKAVKIAGLPEPGDDLKAYYHGVCQCNRPSSAAFEKEM